MQTEIEKYVQINQYLKGQLTADECDAFETSMKSNPDFASEVAMHQMVNEAIVDRYLVDVQANTRKVLAQKAFQTNIWNWGLGLGAMLLVGTIVLLNVSEKEKIALKEHELKFIKKTEAKPSDTPLNQATFKTTKPAEGSSKFVGQPTKPNFTNEVQPAETKEIVLEKIKISEKSALEIVAKESVAKPSEESIADVVPVQNNSEEKKEEIRVVPKDIQLILNLNRNEQVLLPIETDFSGEFLVFGSDGNVVFQQTIRNGFLNTWDGFGISGQVAAGQYGFVLKTENGQIETHGFITVVK